MEGEGKDTSVRGKWDDGNGGEKDHKGSGKEISKPGEDRGDRNYQNDDVDNMIYLYRDD